MMDELQAALKSTPENIGDSHRLLENVPESFYILTPLVKNQFQEAFAKAEQTTGSSIFAQVHEHDGIIRLTGACFPPAYAQMLAMIINTWRIINGFPQLNITHCNRRNTND